MRVVIDTNVLISGIFFGGIPSRIIMSWRDGHMSIVATDDIYNEYVRVLKKLRRQYKTIDIEPIQELIKANAAFVTPYILEEQLCDDVHDDKFIAAALGGNASVIISGDKHLLNISGYKNIIVMKPKDFADTYLE